MKHLRLRHPSPALVVSLIALFVALGGTGYATVRLGKNTVGPRQIKTGAVGSSEVKNKSLKTNDLSSAAVRALQGNTGATGPQGATGGTGPQGATGPSDAWASGLDNGDATFTLAPGSYILSGEAAATAGGSPTVISCAWTATVPAEDTRSQEHRPFGIQFVPANQQAVLAAFGSITVTGPSNFTVNLHCDVGGTFSSGNAIVTKVGTLH